MEQRAEVEPGWQPQRGEPEVADTETFGVVYQPSWLSGFSGSVDYFDIKIRNAISQLTSQNEVTLCADGESSLCPLITRDPVSQQITDVQNVYININEERARGIDLELHYTKNLDGTFLDLFKSAPESLTFGFLGTQLKERSTLIPGAPKFDAVGEIAQLGHGVGWFRQWPILGCVRNRIPG